MNIIKISGIICEDAKITPAKFGTRVGFTVSTVDPCYGGSTKTTYHRVVTFCPTVDPEDLLEGTKVDVIGSMQYRKWDDKLIAEIKADLIIPYGKGKIERTVEEVVKVDPAGVSVEEPVTLHGHTGNDTIITDDDTPF